MKLRVDGDDVVMDQDQQEKHRAALTREAFSKFTDDRYPYALKEWLKGQLVEVYSERIPASEAQAIVDLAWAETGLG